MTGGAKKQTVLFFFDVRCFLQLRIQLDIERVLRVLEDSLVVTGQKPIGKREVVKTEGARFGGQVDFKTGLCEDFKRVQRFGEKEPRFVPSG